MTFKVVRLSRPLVLQLVLTNFRNSTETVGIYPRGAKWDPQYLHVSSYTTTVRHLPKAHSPAALWLLSWRRVTAAKGGSRWGCGSRLWWWNPPSGYRRFLWWGPTRKINVVWENLKESKEKKGWWVPKSASFVR